MKTDEHFEAIVEEHYAPLFRFALSLTRSEPDARDLTQQTFYVLAVKGHQLRDPAKVKTWMFTTLHRTFIRLRRRQARFVDQELDEFAEQVPAESAPGVPALDAAQVLTALGRLDALFRAPVALFYLEDYSYQEIARILEVPVGTVKSRLSRGLGQLRKILLSDPIHASAPPTDEVPSPGQSGERAAATETHCVA